MDPVTPGGEVNTLREWLEKAAAWRVASLLFALPTEDAQRELQGLSQTIAREGRQAATDAFLALTLGEWEDEYHRVLGPGACPAGESSYEENALAGRGPLLAGIAGYYEAFAYRPELPGSETPDHLSIETGFLSYLAIKVAFAEQAGRHEAAEVARRAYEEFLEEHPSHWIGRLEERLEPFGSDLYDVAARWVAGLMP
jgi:TorA maturation chaperone TorD